MTRIGGADHVLALLRARLERMQKRRKDAGSAPKQARSSGVQRLRQIAAAAHGAPEDVERAFLAGILEDEFGSGLVNDQQFPQLTADVLAVLRRDEATHQLLRRAIADLTRK